MKGHMPTDSSPPSPEAVEAAMQLLGRVPKTWAAVPELSHLESQGLGLLVAGGLVERRLSMRLRSVGDKRAVEVRFRFTGQAGLAQAVEPALAEAWALWEAAWKAGRKVYVEPSEGEGEWRLTDQGELAEKCRVGDPDDVRYLRDFLRTPGVPGVSPLPAPLPPFLAGTARFVVNGGGHAERVEVVNADSEPLSVRVENLGEVSGPLGDIARAVEAGLQTLADREKHQVGQDETSGKKSDELSPEARALALLKDHPEWTVAQLAKAVGVHRSTIHRSDDFDAVRKFLAMRKAARNDFPHGRKDRESGKVEAWEDDEVEDEGG